MENQTGSVNSSGLHTLAEIGSYHAHVYFDAGTRDAAVRLRDKMAERFAVQMGRWHDRPIGPHTQPMYQVAFAKEVFASLVPWLMLNRLGLSILVHPNTGNPRRDHEVNALWLGETLPLNTSGLPESGEVTPVITPNTEPRISDI